MHSVISESVPQRIPRIAMESPDIYALMIGGLFGLLLLMRLMSRLWSILIKAIGSLKRYVVYPYILHRHYFCGPFTRARFSLLVVFFSINTCFSVFKVSDVGAQTGNLILVNLIPLYYSFYLIFITDLLKLHL